MAPPSTPKPQAANRVADEQRYTKQAAPGNRGGFFVAHALWSRRRQVVGVWRRSVLRVQCYPGSFPRSFTEFTLGLWRIKTDGLLLFGWAL
jgi:hypothetical protein